MLTAEKIIKEIYLLPIEEREKVALYIIEFGIKSHHQDVPEILDIKGWQNDDAADEKFLSCAPAADEYTYCFANKTPIL